MRTATAERAGGGCRRGATPAAAQGKYESLLWCSEGGPLLKAARGLSSAALTEERFAATSGPTTVLPPGRGGDLRGSAWASPCTGPFGAGLLSPARHRSAYGFRSGFGPDLSGSAQLGPQRTYAKGILAEKLSKVVAAT